MEDTLERPLYREIAENYRPDDVDRSEVLSELESLTERQKEVYELLEAEPMTPEELRDKTDVPGRTARDVLEKLQEIGAVYTFPSLADRRKDLYHVTIHREDRDYDTDNL